MAFRKQAQRGRFSMAVSFVGLDKALRRSIRQTEVRTSELFRCKEPLADEFIHQFDRAVKNYNSPTSYHQVVAFARDAKSWMDDNRETLDAYLGPQQLSPRPNQVNKHQPHFSEAVFATLLRQEFLARYVRFLYPIDFGCVVGGSLSYGQFFNVRQSLDGEPNTQSDIDLLLVGDLESAF